MTKQFNRTVLRPARDTVDMNCGNSASRHWGTAGALMLLSMSVTSGAYGALGTPPNFMVVIGDSYSDSGNAFALTGGTFPYPSGRFSNGPVWVEHLALSLGLDAKPLFAQSALPPDINDAATNFAIGGAQIGYGNSGDTAGGPFFGFATGMSAQKDILLNSIGTVESFYGLAPGSAVTDVFPDSLFVVHAAGNDYRRWTNLSDLDELAAVVADSVESFGTLITDLHNGAGALNFLVPNMPGYTEFDDPFIGTVETARQFADAFNTALAPRLDELRTDLGVSIVEVDFFGLFEEIIANPAAFGITNVGSPCVDFNAFLQVEGICGNPESTLMWDSLHPTSATHALLANTAFSALQPVPIPGAVWLLGSGLLVLVGARRTDTKR